MEENGNINETNTDTAAATGGTGEGAVVIDVPVEKPEEKPGEQAAPAAVVVPEGYVKAEDVETERAARTVAEQARLDAETARTEAETRATAADARARATEIRMAAQSLGFNDPSDAERFISTDAADVSAALAEVLKSKPYLAKQEATPPVVTPTSPTNPARSAATLTLESMKTMTPQQLSAQWPAVMAALKATQ